jgi:hypothetical protein
MTPTLGVSPKRITVVTESTRKRSKGFEPKDDPSKRNLIDSSGKTSKSTRTLANNAMASRPIVEKLRPLLPKDSEETARKVKHLYALLKPATLMDPAFVDEARKRCQGSTVISTVTPEVREMMPLAARLPPRSGATWI